MYRARRLVAFALFIALTLPVTAADRTKQLAKKVDAILAQPDVARGFWGVEVVSLDTGKTLYSQNAEKLFTPASNTKLFTTAATLALIGPDYRFHTTMESTGSLDKYGRLNGDLVLIGRGDPNLSGRSIPYNLRTERKLDPVHVLQELADQVAAKGVKMISGDVVADDSWYPFERYGEGWSQDDLMWEWGAPATALTINDNVVFLTIQPADRPGEKAYLNINPFPDYYHVDNRVMTTPAGTGPRKVYTLREPGSNQLLAWGNIPVDDPGHTESLAIDDPADFAARLMRRLLEERGISIYGRARTHHTDLASLSTFSVTTFASAGGGDTPPAQVPPPMVLANYESAPLAQDLKVINKVSQNLHAELMLRLLGREKGSSGTIDAGLEVLRGFLTQVDIRPEEYVFYDGSGLSRENLVSPHAIVKLLTYTSKQPWAAEFEDTLPVGGVDGTLSDRFKTPGLVGKVHGKTGSLGHVNSLSGYATTAKGEHVVFSILANNHTLNNRRALETIDQIVQAFVNDKSK
jgi:D-alanyl-D-alanine carboxypeptidase/D-alanyl-D-alanine-endopeptidase (penicillin-binding protein 4)